MPGPGVRQGKRVVRRGTGGAPRQPRDVTTYTPTRPRVSGSSSSGGTTRFAGSRQAAVHDLAAKFINKHVSFDSNGTPSGFKTSPQAARQDFIKMRTKALTGGLLERGQQPKLRTAVNRQLGTRAQRFVGATAARAAQAIVSRETPSYAQPKVEVNLPRPQSIAKRQSQAILPEARPKEPAAARRQRPSPRSPAQRGPYAGAHPGLANEADALIQKAADRSHSMPQFRQNVRQMSWKKVRQRTSDSQGQLATPRGNMTDLWRLTYLSGKPKAYKRTIKSIGRIDPENFQGMAKQGNAPFVPQIPKDIQAAALRKQGPGNLLSTKQPLSLAARRAKVNAGINATVKALPGYNASNAWNQDDLGRAINFALLVAPGVGELKAGSMLPWTAKLGILGGRAAESVARTGGKVIFKGGLKAAAREGAAASVIAGKEAASHPVQSFRGLSLLGKGKVAAAGASPFVPQVRKVYAAGAQAATHPETWLTTSRTPLAMVSGPATLGLGALGTVQRGIETPIHNATGLGKGYSGKQILQPSVGAGDLFYKSTKDFLKTLAGGSQHEIEQALQKEWGLFPLVAPALASGALLRAPLRLGRSALRGWVEGKRGGVRGLYRPTETKYDYHIADPSVRSKIEKGQVPIKGDHRGPVSASEEWMREAGKNPNKPPPDIWAIDKKTGEKTLMPPDQLHAYAAEFGKSERRVFHPAGEMKRTTASFRSRLQTVPLSHLAREVQKFRKTLARVPGHTGHIFHRKGFEIAPGMKMAAEDAVGYLFREGVTGASIKGGLEAINHRLEVLKAHGGEGSYDWHALNHIKRNPELLSRKTAPGVWKAVDQARKIDRIVFGNDSVAFHNRNAPTMEAGGIEPAHNRVMPEVQQALGVNTRDQALPALSKVRAQRDTAKKQLGELQAQAEVATGKKAAEIKRKLPAAKGKVTKLQNRIDKAAKHLEGPPLTKEEKATVKDSLTQVHEEQGLPPPTADEIKQEQLFAQQAKKAHSDSQAGSAFFQQTVREVQAYEAKHGVTTPGLTLPPRSPIDSGLGPFPQVRASNEKPVPIGTTVRDGVVTEQSPSVLGTQQPTARGLIRTWHDATTRDLSRDVAHAADVQYRNHYTPAQLGGKTHESVLTQEQLDHLDTEGGKRPQGGAIAEAGDVVMPERFMQDPGNPAFENALKAMEQAGNLSHRLKLGDKWNTLAEEELQKALTKLRRQSGGGGERFMVYPKAAMQELTGQLAKSDAITKFMRGIGRYPATLILSTSFAWMLSQPIAEGLTLGMTTNPRFWVKDAKDIYDLYKHGTHEDRMHLSVLSDAVVGHHILPEDYQRFASDIKPVADTFGWSAITEFSRLATLRPRFTGAFDRWKGNLLRDLGTRAEIRKVSRQADRFGRSMSHTYDQMHFIADNLKGKNLSEQLAWIGAHPKAGRTMEKRLDDMLGNWNALTVNERNLAPLTLFYPFLRFSLDWTFRTFPARHPIKASVAAMLGQISSSQILRYTKNHPSYWQQVVNLPYFGAGPGKPTSFVPATRFIPGGNVLTTAAGAPDLSGLGAAFSSSINPAIGIPFMTMIAGRGSFGQSLDTLPERAQALLTEGLQMSPLTQAAGQFGLSKVPGLSFLAESPAQKVGRDIQGGELNYWVRRGVVPFKPVPTSQVSRYAQFQRAQQGYYKNLPLTGQQPVKQGVNTGELAKGFGGVPGSPFPPAAAAKRKRQKAEHRAYLDAGAAKDHWAGVLGGFYKDYGIKPQYPIRAYKKNPGDATGEIAHGFGPTPGEALGASAPSPKPTYKGASTTVPTTPQAAKNAQAAVPTHAATPATKQQHAVAASVALGKQLKGAGIGPKKAQSIAAAAAKYGVPPEVLASIGNIESTNGKNKNTSSAGAVGPFQFMPETWASVARSVWGNKAGQHDVRNYNDAVTAAAAYLKQSGWKTGDPQAQHDAIYSYNHADWYVNEVLQGANRFRSPEWNTAMMGKAPGRTAPVPTPYTFFLPKNAKFSKGRTDMGWDVDGSPGTPVVAMGKGKITYVGDGGGFGAGMVTYQLLDGPLKGHSIFYGHTQPVRGLRVGQIVKKGQPVTMLSSDGTFTGTGGPGHLEAGFAGGPGQTLSSAHGTSGVKDSPGGTPEGRQFKHFSKQTGRGIWAGLLPTGASGGFSGGFSGGGISSGGSSGGGGAAAQGAPSPTQDALSRLALVQNRFQPGIFAQFASGALSAQSQSPYQMFAPFGKTASASASPFAQDVFGTDASGQFTPTGTPSFGDLAPAAAFASFSRKRKRATST